MGIFKWRYQLVITAVLGIAIGFVVWNMIMLPSSINEAIFRYRLNSAAKEQKKEIRLSELANFEWEEVCELHPYDGDFKYLKYGRTYSAPMNAAHDGVWSLLFIEKDGSPIYIVGSCSRGGAYIREFGCLSRAQATLQLVGSKTCPIY